MKQRTLAAVLVLALAGSAHAGAPRATTDDRGTLGPIALPAHPWTADEEDFICGIENLEHVSHPAVVDYEELYEATPQIREMEEEGIDPDSVEGRALRKAARKLIIKSCQKVREAESHCSVWKAISHEDGRDIPDITEDVLELF